MNKFGIIGHIVQVYPHGSTDTLPFATMGSGSLAAMAVFESRYKEDLTVSCLNLPHLPRGLKLYACVLWLEDLYKMNTCMLKTLHSVCHWLFCLLFYRKRRVWPSYRLQFVLVYLMTWEVVAMWICASSLRWGPSVLHDTQPNIVHHSKWSLEEMLNAWLRILSCSEPTGGKGIPAQLSAAQPS